MSGERCSRRKFLRFLTASGFAVLSSSAFSCTTLRIKLGKRASEYEVPSSTSQKRIRNISDITDSENLKNLASIAKGGSPDDLVKRAVQALGGMGRFVKYGDKVIVKPNICVSYRTYEYAATTNPWIVGAIVRLCLDAGARSVKVMDNPFGGNAVEAYRNSGIEEQVLKNGGKMEVMSDFGFVEVKVPDALDLKKCKVYRDVLEADVLINVPIAKHHGLARLTLGMKNLMGVVQNRPSFHFNLGQRVADLASLLRPTLTIVDAVRILTNNGPTGGRLEDVKKIDTVIASTDFVAADALAATIFGIEPMEVSYIKAASEMGLGEGNLEKIQVVKV